jgi:hypothetical protein
MVADELGAGSGSDQIRREDPEVRDATVVSEVARDEGRAGLEAYSRLQSVTDLEPLASLAQGA